MRTVGAFAKGVYEFIAGDDWITAVGVVVALAVTALLDAGGAAWLITPVAVAVLLAASIRRACRAAQPPERKQLRNYGHRVTAAGRRNQWPR
jgi:membrane protein implicated in regulation of membrane protease activity